MKTVWKLRKSKRRILHKILADQFMWALKPRVMMTQKEANEEKEEQALSDHENNTQSDDESPVIP